MGRLGSFGTAEAEEEVGEDEHDKAEEGDGVGSGGFGDEEKHFFCEGRGEVFVGDACCSSLVLEGLKIFGAFVERREYLRGLCMNAYGYQFNFITIN